MKGLTCGEDLNYEISLYNDMTTQTTSANYKALNDKRLQISHFIEKTVHIN